MKKSWLLFVGWALFVCGLCAESAGKHLFILSGQSNMAGHRPDEAFTPAVEKAFGSDKVIVVQDAQGGQPIQRWYKAWVSPTGEKPSSTGDLYDRLMTKVKSAISGKKLESVTFIWMQGERDAKMSWAGLYKKSFLGLLDQVKADLQLKELNFVIGRLSDFDMENKKYPEWTMVRDIQKGLAEESSNGAWVNTDDLNDGHNRKGKAIKNDLHYSGEGYIELGLRFAHKAITLIQK